MDREVLKELIEKAAHKDIFDGTGRILLEEFIKLHDVSIEKVLDATAELGYPYRIINDHILLITFTAKEGRAPLFERGTDEWI